METTSRPDNLLYDLEHYALKSMELGQLTGLSIGSHAIRDAFLLMHVGVGCKNKAVAHLMVHDASEDANLREGWTEVGDRDLILGASERIAPYMRSWVSRQHPGVLILTSATFIDLAGEDIQDVIQRAATELSIPVLFVPTPGFRGDLFRGYAALMESVLGQMDWESVPPEANRVSLAGYLFDRYERDHSANFSHLSKLLHAIGLTLGPSLFDGSSFSDLMEIPRSSLFIELPYTRPKEKRIGRKLRKREVVQTDLPMGLRGTSRWLRSVAEAAGVWTPALQVRIQRMEDRTRERIEAMVDRWRGTRVAVVADPAHGAGLVSLLLELGFDPVLVGIKGTTMGGVNAFQDALERDGNPLPDHTITLENPSLQSLHESLATLLEEGQLDGVLGSAVDLNGLSELIETCSAPSAGLFTLETGFPCMEYHAFYPMPFLGYQGVEAWVQRLINPQTLGEKVRTPFSQGQ